MSEQWFLMNRGQTSGPFSYEQLERMRSSGACGSFSKVSQDKYKWSPIDDVFNARRVKAAQPAPLQPPELAGAALASGANRESAGQRLARLRDVDIQRPFPLFPLLLLHYLTFGLFTFFWITGLHGQLPRTRSNDLSATKAVGLCFIPFYNLYWFFVVYPRLSQRVNALCRQHHLQQSVSVPLAYSMCVLMVVPVTMATAGIAIVLLLLFSPTSKSEAVALFFGIPNLLTAVNFLVVVPIFASQTQRGINQVFDAQLAALSAQANMPQC